MKLADYRRFKMAIRVSVPKSVADDIIGKFDDLRDIIYGIQSTARMIVETQTEMHPGHKILVQMIVTATEQVEFEQPLNFPQPTGWNEISGISSEAADYVTKHHREYLDDNNKPE